MRCVWRGAITGEIPLYLTLCRSFAELISVYFLLDVTQRCGLNLVNVVNVSASASASANASASASAKASFGFASNRKTSLQMKWWYKEYLKAPSRDARRVASMQHNDWRKSVSVARFDEGGWRSPRLRDRRSVTSSTWEALKKWNNNANSAEILFISPRGRDVMWPQGRWGRFPNRSRISWNEFFRLLNRFLY